MSPFVLIILLLTNIKADGHGRSSTVEYMYRTTHGFIENEDLSNRENKFHFARKHRSSRGSKQKTDLEDTRLSLTTVEARTVPGFSEQQEQ